jgi:hypothetical protein
MVCVSTSAVISQVLSSVQFPGGGALAVATPANVSSVSNAPNHIDLMGLLPIFETPQQATGRDPCQLVALSSQEDLKTAVLGAVRGTPSRALHRRRHR